MRPHAATMARMAWYLWTMQKRMKSMNFTSD